MYIRGANNITCGFADYPSIFRVTLHYSEQLATSVYAFDLTSVCVYSNFYQCSSNDSKVIHVIQIHYRMFHIENGI